MSPSPEDPPTPQSAAQGAADPGSEEPDAGAGTGSGGRAAEASGPANRGPWTAAARDALRILIPAALVAMTAVVLAAPFLHLYSHEHLRVPLGFDTPKYVWRANLVGGEGVASLAGSAPTTYKVDPGRVGQPVLTSLVHAVVGVSPFRFSFVAPAVMAVVIGLAAGALAVGPLREPPWAFPVYAIAVGASVNVFLTGVGYADNLMVDGIAVAIAAVAVAVSGGRASIGALALLFAGGVLTHSVFMLLLGLILACVVAASVPESLLAVRRKRAPLRRTPAARLAIALAVAGVAVVVAVLVTPSHPQGAPAVPRYVSMTKLGLFAPKYHFAVVGAAAAAGIVALWWPKDPTRRRGMALAVVWALSALAAVVALVQLHHAVPAHRVVGFAFGIPVLAAAAVTGVARLLASRGPVAVRVAGGVAGAALVLAALGYTVAIGYDAWSGKSQSINPDAYQQALTAGRYLEDAHIERPVIFVVNPGTPQPRLALYENFGLVRAAVPPSVISRTFVYLGDPAQLRHGRPTLRTNQPAFDTTSRRYFQYLEPYLGAHPVVFLLRAQNPFSPPSGRLHGAWPITPDVVLLAGPRVESARPAPVRLMPLSQGTLSGWTAGILALLFVAGFGWSAALVDGGWWERAALAPAIGVAALVVVGLAGSRLGAGLLGSSGTVLAATAAVLGWAAFGVRAWRPWRLLRRRASGGRPVETARPAEEPG
ncbi:MAG: hypothetical protein ACJ77A_13635 [Actinomycetota bacterium]